ncbi:MAG: NgoMIV family type II restriction endonuclease [Cyanobacteria bacterium P01_F01_bin.33]
MPESFLSQARTAFHAELLKKAVLAVNTKGVPSNADGSNKLSRELAMNIADQLQAEAGERLAGQTSGNEFEQIVAHFLDSSFRKFSVIRPGSWVIAKVGGRSRTAVAEYGQYAHLLDLHDAIEQNPSLLTALGNDYAVAPDVVVVRLPEPDASINKDEFLVDDFYGILADIREKEGRKPLLHASVSTKWTLRSDRAQNARAEALNLIRNRKGRQPHIVLVTGEPTPSRLSSLALGTGDLDCIYHFALPELKNAVDAQNEQKHKDLLDAMIEGRRLKDIADLPLDLAV